MTYLRAFLSRLWVLFGSRQMDRDIDDEISSHLAEAKDEYIQRGLSPEDAHAAALRSFGGVTQTKEVYRQVRSFIWLDDVGQDLRYTIRALRRSPGFTTAACVTLALGIGANTAIFSIVNSLLLRELPVQNPHRLATVSSEPAIKQGRLAGSGWNYPMWERFRDRAEVFDGAFVWMPRQLSLAKSGEMQPVEGLITTSDFFRTLGLRAVLGRTFTRSDDRRGGHPAGPVTVISYAFWQRHLAGARDVIGTPLLIEGVPFTIAGVAPPGFTGVEVGRSFDVALTFGMEPLIGNRAAIDQPNAFGLIPMVRLKPGQTWEAATAALRVLQPDIHGSAGAPPFLQDPFVLVPAPTGTSVTGFGMSGLRQRYERPLLMVFVIVGLLLIMSCTNVTNLLLVRARSRRRELSVRLALGASRWRLARQLFIESLLLGMTGAACALVLARWTTTALVRQMSTVDTPVSLDVPFDWRVLAFTTAVATVTIILVGVTPAFRAARETPIDPTKTQGSRRWGAGGGPSHGLIMVQVALSLVLLVAAGLLVQTVSRLAAVPLGFDRNEVLLVTVDTRRASTGAETRPSLYARLVTAVSAVPGVDHATASTSVPIRRGLGVLGVSTPQMPDAQRRTLFNFVSPQWFATYGIPLVAGRDFDAHDSANAAPVVIVNKTLARLVFPGRDPLGERVFTQAPNWQPLTVVGVVGDAVSHSLRGTQAGSALRDPVAPTIYVPLAQAESLRPPGASEITISVRPSAGSPSQLAAGIGAALTSLDPSVTFSFRLLADFVNAAFATERLVAMLSGVFGALALFLAGIGLYGVSSYAVSQRRTEIGVRIALGAAPRSVVRLILGRVAILIGLGIIEGIVLSLWVVQVVSSLLYGLSLSDPATLMAAILTVSTIGLAAGWFPAWRAARIEPVEVLREY